MSARLRPHLSEFDAVRLAAPAQTGEYQDPLVIEVAALLRLDPVSLPRAQDANAALFQAGQPPPAAGCGPSTITYSISGCAHPTQLKSPRSQAA